MFIDTVLEWGGGGNSSERREEEEIRVHNMNTRLAGPVNKKLVKMPLVLFIVKKKKKI